MFSTVTPLRNLSLALPRRVSESIGSPDDYLLTFNSWQRVAHAVLGSHVLLNLRKANETRIDGTEKQKLSSIVFRRPKASRDGRTIIGTTSRSLVERVGDDVEDWLAPDPQLYPSMVSPIPPQDGIEVELEAV